MKRMLAALGVLMALAMPVRAQSKNAPWGQPIGLSADFQSAPETPTIKAVKLAISEALCDDAAVAWVNANTVIKAISWPAGPGWPMQTLMWYGKGADYCEGKWQFGGPDGPYTNGYEIRWDSTSWVDDPTYGKRHPTRFTIVPWGPVDPTATLPPLSSTPVPPPVVDVQPLKDSVASLLLRVDEQQKQLDAAAAQLADLTKAFNAIVPAMNTLAANVETRLKALEARPVVTACRAAIVLGARIPISCSLQ